MKEGNHIITIEELFLLSVMLRQFQEKVEAIDKDKTISSFIALFPLEQDKSEDPNEIAKVSLQNLLDGFEKAERQIRDTNYQLFKVRTFLEALKDGASDWK